MNTLLVVFFICVFGQSTSITLHRETAPGIWVGENVTEPLKGYRASMDDVKIYFRNRDCPNSKDPLDITNPSKVDRIGFSNNKDTVFIIHGWRSEFNASICEEISEAVLAVNDANVFLVDWSSIASNLYIIAHSAVPQVADIVSTLITDLVKDNGLDLDRTFIAGHSLGAHIAGLCGSDLNGKIHHIVGLDPALPLFNWADIDGRLDPTDAQFVEVIHTCAGLLGFDREIGHVDYWPNGGSHQPGCGGIFDFAGMCSHGRSYYYFAESILSGGFVAHKCDSYSKYTSGDCDSEPKSQMGGYNLDKKANGSYFLTTNDKYPFAQH